MHSSGEEQTIYELARVAQQKAIRRRRRASRKTPAMAAAPRIIAQSPTQRAGRAAEDQAGHYLEAAGLVVLARNLRCRAGEIDIVCRDRRTLVFIEVRRRRSARYGGAAASVNLKKQQRLIRAAGHFLPDLARRHFGGRVPACRFDVVAVEPGGLNWLRHAFTAGPPARSPGGRGGPPPRMAGP